MAKYEILVMFDSQASSGEKSALEIVTSIVEKHKGKVISSDDWGERPLTFDIKGRDKAAYLLVVSELAPGVVKKVANLLKLEKDILRLLITRIE